MSFIKEGKVWDRDKLLDMAHIASLFEQELVKEFFDRTEYTLWKRWTDNPDYDEREKLYLQSQGLAAFRSFVDTLDCLNSLHPTLREVCRLS